MKAATVRTAQYWVYMLKCSDKTLYTGVTNDLRRRVREHNSGSASKYTRSRRPVSLVYAEVADGKSIALKRESAIKKLSRSAKLLLCASYSPGSREGAR